jgi:hypothetical protein
MIASLRLFFNVITSCINIKGDFICGRGWTMWTKVDTENGIEATKKGDVLHDLTGRFASTILGTHGKSCYEINALGIGYDMKQATAYLQ